MTELESASVVFVILLGATGLGVIVRPWLPEEHKATDTVQVVQLVVGMLVTFAALVLGLLTASAKTVFDTNADDIRAYATELIQLDNTLRQYGVEGDAPRQLLRAYTAAAIASTWANEPRPPGNYYPVVNASEGNPRNLDSHKLGDMLDQAQRDMREMQPHDSFHQKLMAEALTQFDRLLQQRWKLVEESHGTISSPFDRILVFWLIVIFLCFGLIAPRNLLSLVTITLGALSIASALYVILDLDTPFTGAIIVPSQPLRDALAYLSR